MSPAEVMAKAYDAEFELWAPASASTTREGAFKVRDISARLRADELVCCPLCDGTIETCHVAEIVEAHGLKQLVHANCADELDEEQDE